MRLILKSMVALFALCGAVNVWGASEAVFDAPIAVWRDFNNLTSGEYTLTLDESCSVDADGSVTLGGSGILLDGTNMSAVSLIVEMSDIQDTGTLISYDIYRDNNHIAYATAAKDGTVYKLLLDTIARTNKTYSLAGTEKTIMFSYGATNGTGLLLTPNNLSQGYTDGDLKYGSSVVKSIRIGAYGDGTNMASNGVTASSAGMKIHAIYLYDEYKHGSGWPTSTTKDEYHRAVAGGDATWSSDSAWGETGVTAPVDNSDVYLNVSDAAILSGTNATLNELTINPLASSTEEVRSVKLLGDSLTVSKSTINVDTDVSEVATASLGEVAVADGKTLTIADVNAPPYTSLTMGATSTLKQTAPTGTITTTSAYKQALAVPTSNTAADVTVTPNGGEITISGAYTNFALANGSATTTQFTFENTTIEVNDTEASNTKFGFGAGEVFFKEGTSIKALNMRLSDGAVGVTTTVTQSGGTIELTATGTGTGNHMAVPLLFGSWNGGASSTYNLSGGVLDVSSGSVYLGKGTGSPVSILNISGGELRAKGIAAKEGRQEVNLSNGRVILGASGISAGTNMTFTFSGGVLTTCDDTSVGEDVVIPAEEETRTASVFAAATGTTLTISGTISGSGDIAIGTETEHGKVHLANVDGYTGHITSIASGTILEIGGGVIPLESDAVIGADAEIHVLTGGTLDLSGKRVPAGVKIIPAGGLVRLSAETTWAPGAELAIDLSTIMEPAKLLSGVTEDMLGNIPMIGRLPSSALVEKIHDGIYEIAWADGLTTPLDYQLTWLPIGDSITEGENNFISVGGYRYHLWELLDGAQSTGVATAVTEGTPSVDLKTVGFRTGHKGTDAPDAEGDYAWHAGLYQGTISPLDYDRGAHLFNIEPLFENVGYPDIISVLIGTNDVTLTNDVESIVKDWTALIQRLSDYRPHSKIVVSTIIPMGDAANADDKPTQFNEALRLKKERGDAPFDNANVIFVDVSKLVFGDTYLSDLYKPNDAYHPNVEGSKKMAQAFRLGFLEAVQKIKEESEALPRIVHVHNGVNGKVSVRLNIPVTPGTYSTLELSKEGSKTKTALAAVTSDDTTPIRELMFTVAENDVILGMDAVALKNDVTTINADAHTDIDLVGSGVEMNVPLAYRENYVKYQTITLGEGTTTESKHSINPGTLPEDFELDRVGYYVELKREGKPAQFVWVSMDATAFGENPLTKISVPDAEMTTGLRATVSKLQVYGNRGNFTKEVMSGNGIIEFTGGKYWANNDATPAEPGNLMVMGWNDRHDNSGGTVNPIGCMQVAHIRDRANGSSTDPAAEMIFAYNNFNKDDAMSDVGIGTSLSVNCNNSGSSNIQMVAYDWSKISEHGYTAYQPSAYRVKTIEIWVRAPQEATRVTWRGTTSGAWNEASNWEPSGVPNSLNDALTVVLDADAPHTLQLTEGVYLCAFDGENGRLTIADNAEVTLSATNTHTGGIHIGVNTTLSLGNAAALGTGIITGSGRIVYPGGYPTNMNGLTDASNWSGTVEVSDMTLTATQSLEALGNKNAIINLKGTNTGTLADGAVCEAHVELSGTLTLTGGNTNGQYTFNSLSGDGTLDNSVNVQGYTIQIKDVSAFKGRLYALHGRSDVLVGEGEAVAGKLIIAGNANIVSALPWQANKGIVVTSTGIIKGSGSVESPGSGSTALTFEAGATLDATAGILSVMNTNKTVAYNGAINILIPAWTDNTLVLKTTDTDVPTATVYMMANGIRMAAPYLTVEHRAVDADAGVIEAGLYVVKTAIDPDTPETPIPSEATQIEIATKAEAAGVTTVTEVLVQGTGAEALPSHSVDAVELFDNILTVTPTAESATTGTATIVYDFGITKMTIDANENVILTVTVQNTSAEGETNTAAIAKDVLLKVFDAEAADGAEPLAEQTVTAAASEVELSIPLTVFDTVKAHKLKVEAVK